MIAVLAHHLPLGLVERPRLAQDRLGDRDLAHVVQLRGARDLVERLDVEPHPTPDGQRQQADVVDVLLELGLTLAQHLHQQITTLAAR